MENAIADFFAEIITEYPYCHEPNDLLEFLTLAEITGRINKHVDFGYDLEYKCRNCSNDFFVSINW